MSISFWGDDYTILLNKDFIFEMYPLKDMSIEIKYNAITRLIILLTIIGYILTTKITIIIIGILTLGLIYSLYYYRKKEMTKEGFLNDLNENLIVDPITLNSALKTDFYPITKNNPFSNVLLTDINDEPNKLAAPPSFDPKIKEDITNVVKEQVQMLNPTIENTNEKLYGSLYDSYNLDKSLQRFYSTANTRVVNDQGAFAQYLYGNMPSGKSSDVDGELERVKNNYRYILI